MLLSHCATRHIFVYQTSPADLLSETDCLEKPARKMCGAISLDRFFFIFLTTEHDFAEKVAEYNLCQDALEELA